MMFLALYSLLNDPWHVTSFTICCTWRTWHIQPSHHNMRAWDKHVSYCILSSLLMSLIFLWRDWELLCFEKGMAGGGLTSGFIGGEDCEWGLLLILNTKSYVPISLSHSKFRPSESLKTWEIVWVHHFYSQ